MNKILLCGNPNVGKSTIFNLLTKSNEHTGNWTGKTVDIACKKIKNTNFELIDLPGVYSLNSFSPEECVTRNYLLFEDYEKIIYVCDASNIEKSLLLLLQILEINNNVILCLNMVDELNKKNIVLDVKKLERILNIPCIMFSAKEKNGVNKLLDLLDDSYSSNYVFNYSSYIEEKINEISLLIQEPFNSKFICYKVLERDNNLIKEINDRYDINIINDDVKKYLSTINSEFISDEISIKLNNLSNKISYKVIKRKSIKKISFIDKIFSSKILALPLFILLIFILFYLTIVLANYPGELLSYLFDKLELFLLNLSTYLNLPTIIYEPLIFGIYRVISFVISVMFPPLVIFFIFFTYMEESGILPRIAFNSDYLFNKCNCHGKQCLTMCTAIGCNACAVVGSRIIDSKKDRLISILTNSFIPCNGRIPMIIAITSMFFVNSNNKLLLSFIVTLFILFSIFISLLISYILSKTLLKGYNGFFILEMPDFKKVNILKILKLSIIDKSINILIKAIKVSIPAGLFIWILSNSFIHDISLFNALSNILDPISHLIGLDGVIVLAFFLGLPANEIVLPIIIMGYLGNSSLNSLIDNDTIKNILINNGWSFKTALSFILFSIMHFPCMTTLLTIKDEVGYKWMIYSFLIPFIVGVSILFILNIFI